MMTDFVIYLTMMAVLLVVIILVAFERFAYENHRDKQIDKKDSTQNLHSYFPRTPRIPNTTIPAFYQKKVAPNTRMFSEISQREVLLCCYNAARLNDRYCVCGRGVVYPILA